MVNRRQVLKGIGASSTILGLATTGGAAGTGDGGGAKAIATGAVDNEAGLPVHAEGTTTVEYEPHPEYENAYRRRRTFESEDLYERYGDRTFRYEPRTVHEATVPDGAVGDTPVTVDDRQVVGRVEEHRTAERTVWERRDRETGVLDVPDIEGNVPVFHYENEDDAADRQNRGAPLNVAWETEDAASIKDHMESGDGGGRWLPGPVTAWEPARVDKYVNLPDGGTKSTDVHVMRYIFNWWCSLNTTQWHVRIYDVPFDGIAAVGQAHRDPCDHGKIVDRDVDWRIADAREEVENFWEDGHPDIEAEEEYVGNTDGEYASHDGQWAYFDDA